MSFKRFKELRNNNKRLTDCDIEYCNRYATYRFRNIHHNGRASLIFHEYCNEHFEWFVNDGTPKMIERIND